MENLVKLIKDSREICKGSSEEFFREISGKFVEWFHGEMCEVISE